MTSTTAPVPENHATTFLRRTPAALLNWILIGVEGAKSRASTAADLRRRLRADARLLRDIGISRFEALRLTNDI